MEPNEMSYPWFALQVRSRYENIVAAQLTGKGYEWFLPIYKCRHRWSDRFKETERPLFRIISFAGSTLKSLQFLQFPGLPLIVEIAKTPVPIEIRRLLQYRP